MTWWNLGRRVLRGHRGSILTLFAFSEAKLLLSGGRDNLIRCWVPLAHTFSLPALIALERLASYRRDIAGTRPYFHHLTVLCQDMETLVCRRTLGGHKNDIMSIAGLAQEAAAAGPGACAPGSANEVRAFCGCWQRVPRC